MSALKIKDAQGNWIEVPMIKGDKGDKGEQGDTYELTEQDKQDIADLVDVPEPLKYVKDDSSNNFSVIEGCVSGTDANEATGAYSHAEGLATKALGYASHVEGQNNRARGYYSHSEGYGNITSGTSSHAEGEDTEVISGANASHVEGKGTLAITSYQHAQGKYNNPSYNYVFMIGNGSSKSNRSNAMTVDWNGNGVYAGKVTVGTAPTADMDVATKKYVDDVKGASIHICSSAEYDSTTRVPTIQNPDEKTFYLVPSEDGTSPDLFVEWAYVNNNWEMFGSASIDLSGYLTDVQVNENSVVTDGVANIPIANTTRLGVVKINTSFGIMSNVSGDLAIYGATTSEVKNATTNFKPITPRYQHESVFYGLAKASGDLTQYVSDNAVGTYTDEAKASIQNMLGVPSVDDIPDVPVEDVQINGTSIVTDGVAKIPVASNSVMGVAKFDVNNGINVVDNTWRIVSASSIQVKDGRENLRPVVPNKQHESTFYGLAKASGDTTQSQSSNPVGTYTDEAKQSIKQMLGVIDSYDSLVVNVTGTDPVITAQPSYRYNCGEVTSLTITPPTSGTIDFIFTSGTTPTVLDLPNTVKMPSWWIGVEANTTYEMCITDGVYCGVMSWDA